MRSDPAATVWAVLVAAAATFALALGGWLWWLFSGFGAADSVFLKSVVFGSLASLLMWLVWLLVVYALLERIAGVRPPVEQLLRAAGFATAPLAIGIFMAVPAISFGAGVLALAAWVLAMQLAIERASGVSGRDAALANLGGFAVWIVAMSLLTTASNQFGPGPLLAESIWDALAGYEAGQAVLGQ